MHFKHPEFLYVLFALLIPVLIHLFQLRRFRKVYFSNVQFLKAVSIQTRKSSQIKKWLILLTRMLALAALIFAFAQPFFAKEDIVGKKSETVLYLDNSFSMQAKGAKGSLLQRSVQELLSNLPENEIVSVFTNNETFRNVSKKDIQNDLLQLEYSAHQIPYKAAYLKGKQLFNNTPNTIKRLVMISDFQQKLTVFELPTDADTKTSLVQVVPVTRKNIAVDSLFVERNNDNELLLHVILSNTEGTAVNIPIALYNDKKLLAKTAVSIPTNGKTNTQFKLADNTKINGRVVLEDPSLTFDNTRYFTMNMPEKIKVVAINEASDDFIRKIFTNDEFALISTPLNSLNYNDINLSNLLIINELKEIPVSLTNALTSLIDQGGTICFIPSPEGNINSYQQFISSFSSEGLLSKQKNEKNITGIKFSHPLYKGVFDKKITNFQYPKVNSWYQTNASNSILTYEDNTPFLYKTNALYIFTAGIDTKNSNFKNSPLIVPTLYNIGKQSFQLSDISYTIGQNNTYDVPVSLGQDGILILVSKKETIIPLQQGFATKVQITTDDVPSIAGIYALQNKEKLIQNVSYNYDTSESDLQYYNLTTTDTYEVTDSVAAFFKQVNEESRIDELWKWFIIFALLFLLVEIMLLKYLK